MKVNLFNDKQVSTIFKSVSRVFSEQFNKAEDEVKNILDAEVKRQLETNADIQAFRNTREVKLEASLKLAELSKQVEEISEGLYTISTPGYARRNALSIFKGNIEKATNEFNETTDKECNELATIAAEKVLGIDNIDYRKECMYHDIKARVATMAVSDYDSVVSLLEPQIKIKDYFVTL